MESLCVNSPWMEGEPVDSASSFGILNTAFATLSDQKIIKSLLIKEVGKGSYYFAKRIFYPLPSFQGNAFEYRIPCDHPNT